MRNLYGSVTFGVNKSFINLKGRFISNFNNVLFFSIPNFSLFFPFCLIFLNFFSISSQFLLHFVPFFPKFFSFFIPNFFLNFNFSDCFSFYLLLCQMFTSRNFFVDFKSHFLLFIILSHFHEHFSFTTHFLLTDNRVYSPKTCNSPHMLLTEDLECK